ncbi:MAG: tRNA epoxyqueuosine(34) reductase QueG [Bacteroidales bacterium]|jgi:epoxyqueuosine reductase|nr:tRNA epoxyqueuosine(34) reductase QueG [Bacteroidales bacterium]
MHETALVNLSQLVKAKAKELGFDLCGIARARKLQSAEAALTEWCGEGMHDKMNYLAHDTAKRADPSILFPGAKTVIVTGLNYFTRNRQKHASVPIISIYALGKNYHDVIIPKLNRLLACIQSAVPGTNGRAYCDTAPVMEKSWAVEAGLGWRGKHSVIINESIGSFFFIGILLLDIEMDYDAPCPDEKCGSCRACIDSCPVGAINDNRTIDTRKCIASLTIESKEALPEHMVPLMGRLVYGCDICQETCPWNRNTKEHNIHELIISSELAGMDINDWLDIDEIQFRKILSGTPAGRVRYERFKRNIETVSRNF